MKAESMSHFMKRAWPLLTMGLLGVFCGPTSPSWAALLIEGARVIDGTGAPGRTADVRIEGDEIVAVGDLTPARGEIVVQGEGYVLAPGFIDTHSHADSLIFELRDAEAAVSQGVTTLVVGQDGSSPFPLAEFFARLEEMPAAVNVASYVGQGTLRQEVMGQDFRRAATPEEIEAMRALLEEEMASGAIGFGTGLEYDPGIYSETEEVVVLARAAAALGGRYASHIRSEDRFFWEAIDEILTIGREAQIPVHISHIKLAMRNLHGSAERLISILDGARASGVDVSADLYPYAYWQSTLTVLFPERNFEDLEEARLALREITTPEGALLVKYEPEPALAGRTLADIAASRGEEPARVLLDLIRKAQAFEAETGRDDVESLVATSMIEPDIVRLLQWPNTNVGSDGGLEGAHPRGYGTFPRILGRYVRERGVLSLEEAVRKMTSLSAEHLGIGDRGIIAPGRRADLVLFDPDTAIDRATPESPHLTSRGIERVWVNGEEVWGGEKTTGRYPGRVIRRASPEER
jgi:N-acyl-D-amino-acid deacylase